MMNRMRRAVDLSCIFHNKTYTKLNSVNFLVRLYYFCVGTSNKPLPNRLIKQQQEVDSCVYFHIFYLYLTELQHRLCLSWVELFADTWIRPLISIDMRYRNGYEKSYPHPLLIIGSIKKLGNTPLLKLFMMSFVIILLSYQQGRISFLITFYDLYFFF